MKKNGKIKKWALNIGIIIVIIIVFLTVKNFMARIVHIPKLSNNPEASFSESSDKETLTTSNSADIESIVSEMVEKQVSEILAQENYDVSTTSVPSNYTDTSEESITSTALEAPHSISSKNELSITAYRNGTEYNLIYMDDPYKSAFYALYFEDGGRDVEFTISKNIMSVSVSSAFIQEDRSMSDFSNFSELGFTETDTGTAFVYSIPDNPFGVPYNSTSGKEVGICSIFRIETGSGVYYTAISY